VPGNTPNTFFFLYYAFLTGIFLLLLLKISKKNLVTDLIRSLRPFPIFHGGIMVLLGIIIAGNLDIIDFFNHPFTNTFGFILISVLTVVFAWSFTVLLNHIYDIDIDKISGERRITSTDVLTIDQIKQIAIIFAILSILFSTLIGYEIFLLTVTALILGIVYSIPPIRLRNSILSSLFIGTGSVIAFFIGVLTPPFYWTKGGLKLANPIIPSDAFPIALIIFISLSVGTVIKDLKNYEGDKNAGVRNIFTVYGLQKGLKIASVSLFISFVTPLILFHEIVDFLIIIPTGVFALFLFKKFRSIELTFAMYFFIFFYLLLRWIEVI
jgi:homogentisate phytyltransferase/homogentisate geranylgeranyltransferase